MFRPDLVHIAIFLLIVLLVLGPKRLPEVGRSLGRGLREFKDSIGGVRDDFEGEPHGLPAKTPVAAERSEGKAAS